MSSRRIFLKKGVLAIFGAMGSISIARAEKSPQSISQSIKWGMVIDLNRCMGCQSCVIACKAQNNTVSDGFSTRIVSNEIGNLDEPRRSFIPVLCNQCENPACEKACPVNALIKLPNGVVVADWEKCDPDKCKPISNGIGACVAACPYNANFLDSRYGDKVDKCDFCLSRVEKGLDPACVESCSSKARLFGDMNAPKGEFAEYLKNGDLRRRRPEVKFEEYLKRIGFMRHKPEMKIKTSVFYLPSRKAKNEGVL